MASLTGHKRRADSPRDSEERSSKRSRLSEEDGETAEAEGIEEQPTRQQLSPKPSEKAKGKRKMMMEEVQVQKKEDKTKGKIRKLAPPRPFPTVPTSVSATGPRSAHIEGKNYICITRKTPLGAYLRRCKGVILKDGHKTLHLNAMGAAIPHLLQLTLSLPSILPYPPNEIHTEVLTGTVEVQDEIIPEDEDEDISYRTRGKSSLSVVVRIGDGIDEGPRTGKGMRRESTTSRRAVDEELGEGRLGKKGKHKQKIQEKNATQENKTEQMVFREEDMDDE